MHLFEALFLDFQIQQLSILKPVEVGKSYIPQKKALLPIDWKKFWNWKNFYHASLQKSFSGGGLKMDLFY